MERADAFRFTQVQYCRAGSRAILATLCRDLLTFFGMTAAEKNICACIGTSMGDRFADAAPGTRDHHHPGLKIKSERF